MGREAIKLRPSAGTKQALADLARCWGCSMTEAFERAVREALDNNE